MLRFGVFMHSQLNGLQVFNLSEYLSQVGILFLRNQFCAGGGPCPQVTDHRQKMVALSLRLSQLCVMSGRHQHQIVQLIVYT